MLLPRVIGARAISHTAWNQVRWFNGSVGIVGVPNVGKSLLFNVLNQSSIAASANYPFCTIEPNVANTVLTDKLLRQMGKVENSAKVVEGTIEIRDIAGLVKGASSGCGLGNAFLSHIRGVSVLLHVVRCFDDPQISRVDDSSSPVDELRVVMDELILSDIDVVGKRVAALEKSGKVKRCSDVEEQLEVARSVLKYLENGQPGRLALNKFNRTHAKELSAITTKPVCIVCNVDAASAASGNAMSQQVMEVAKSVGADNVVVISAKMEDELNSMKDDEDFIKSYLEDLGIRESAITKVLRSCLSLLNLGFFYTVGREESKIWFFRSPATVAEASAAIHSSFPQLVLNAEVCCPEDILEMGGWTNVKNKGMMNVLGKDKQLEDGLVVHFQLRKTQRNY